MGMKAIFVGDAPSTKNFDQDVAFEGTKSGKTLKEWIKDLPSITEYTLINSHRKTLIEYVKIMLKNDPELVVIALGNVASRRLKNQNIVHLSLPHPSSKNRNLNNPAYIEKQLKICHHELRWWAIRKQYFRP